MTFVHNKILALPPEVTLNQFGLQNRVRYNNASPFPHIVLDNFFDSQFLSKCADEFPNLSLLDGVIRHSGRTDEKLASPRGTALQPPSISSLFSFLNSSDFIDFLQALTSIKESLIPDPHFVGGGLHQIRSGGFLKIHADFCRHPETNLDRRLNLLIYLNKNTQMLLI